MPAVVKRTLGSSKGIRPAEGITRWPFFLKYSKKVFLISIKNLLTQNPIF
jgi:hypothetical protein